MCEIFILVNIWARSQRLNMHEMCVGLVFGRYVWAHLIFDHQQLFNSRV